MYTHIILIYVYNMHVYITYTCMHVYNVYMHVFENERQKWWIMYIRIRFSLEWVVCASANRNLVRFVEKRQLESSETSLLSPLRASWEARSQTQSLTPSDPSIPVPSPRSPSGNHGTDRRAVERALGLEEKWEFVPLSTVPPSLSPNFPP